MMLSHAFHRFTLLELLVVIGIIAILASLLLPSLNRARGYAKSIFCQNNMGQFGLSYANYTNDSKEYLPPHTSSADWITNMKEYLPHYRNGHKTDLLTCPIVGPVNTASASTYSDICINQYAAINTSGSYSAASKIVQIKKPSATFLGFEFAPNWSIMGSSFYKLNGEYYLQSYRHNFSDNTVSLDYHCENYQLRKIPNTNSNGTPWSL